MVLQLSPLKEEEIQQWEVTAATAFESGLGHLLTGPNTPENIAEKSAKALKDLKENPASRYLKVTDSETGEIVAGAQWLTYTNGNSEAELDKMFKTDTGEPGYRADWEPVYAHLKDNRREIMGKRPYYYLNVLFTHPKHHRRGAGAMLLRWGMEEADRLGVECYMEASIEGRPLYERNGFKVIKEAKFDMAEFGRPELGVDINCCMRRAAIEKTS